MTNILRLTTAVILFFLFSCSKPSDLSSIPAQRARPTTGDKLPGGGTGTSTGGQTSGVSMETGYEQLSKHLAGGQWDGTYDFDWYNLTFNVSVAAYALNSGMGSPVGFTFNNSSAYQSGASVPTAVASIGPGITAFTFTYTLVNLGTASFYDDMYSSNGLSNWANATQTYFTYLNNLPPGTTPKPPPMPPVDSVVALSNPSSMVVTVYGKFIYIIPGPSDVAGIPYAAAEISWTPANDNYYCNNQCQYCAAHPNDPTCPQP
jgi:hypothetical protein